MTTPISDIQRNGDLDEFITPPTLIRACLSTLWHDRNETYTILDPGCNRGQWGTIIRQEFPNAFIVGVEYMDVPKNNDYNVWLPNQDFFAWQPDVVFDFVLGNPPYSITTDKRRVVVDKWIKHSFRFLSKDGIMGYVLRKGFNHNLRAWRTVLNDYPPLREHMLIPRPNFYGNHDTRTDGSSGAQWDYSFVLFDNNYKGATQSVPLFWKGKP